MFYLQLLGTIIDNMEVRTYQYNCDLCNKQVVTLQDWGDIRNEWFEFEGYLPQWNSVKKLWIGGKPKTSKSPTVNKLGLDDKIICNKCLKKKYDPKAWVNDIKDKISFYQKKLKELKEI